MFRPRFAYHILFRMIREPMDLVECSPCGQCGAWVVLRLTVYDSELELYEFTCPRCGVETGAADTKLWRLPRRVNENGHFTLEEYHEFEPNDGRAPRKSSPRAALKRPPLSSGGRPDSVL